MVTAALPVTLCVIVACGKLKRKGENDYGKTKKEKELARENRITIRLSDIEYELVCKQAERSGLSVSEFIRKAISHENIQITHVIQAEFPDVTEQMKAICSELHSVGSNLNQIAKYFNMGGLRSKAMQDEICNCFNTIMKIQKDTERIANDVNGNIKVSIKQKR